ncbi:MAG TPA: response regulator [Labilithrix sp.]|nr:response regulator [Labilithrix sp.]
MRWRVLIADDSAVARAIIVRRIRQAGFDLEEHDSCASASRVDPSTVDCALLDFDLGDGLGVDVAKRLRSARATLPIAFFTSTSREEAAEPASSFGPIFSKAHDLEVAIDWIKCESLERGGTGRR